MSFDPSDYNIPTQEWGPCVYECGYKQAKERRTIAVGLDLASRNDYPAVAVLEKIESPEVDAAGSPVFESDMVHQKLTIPRYEVRNLRRLARGTSYLPIIAEVGRLMSHPDLAGATLCVDRNGVGDVFFDLLVAANFKNLMAVVTTGSTNREKHIEDGFSVGKQQLVNALQAVLQTGRLKIARDGEFVKEFMEELRAFSVTVSDRGHASYAAAGSAKDDLVMACAYGLFPLYDRKMGAWTSESLSL